VEIKLNTEDLRQAVFEYVARQVMVPEGYHVDIQDSYYLRSVTAEVVKNAEPETPQGSADGTLDEGIAEYGLDDTILPLADGTAD